MDLEAFSSAAADLVLGVACVGCERPGLALCSACSRCLTGLPFRTWPDPCPPGLPPVWAVTAYADAARAALVAHKEDGRLALARPLGRALAVAALGLLASLPGTPGRVHLVPVPSRPGVVRERGHDPLLRMTREARQALRRCGIQASVTSVLRQRRAVADQAGLQAADRAANLAGAFVTRSRLPAGPAQDAWVVVDDIITTGATALEAASALAFADVSVLGVAVVAATARHTSAGTYDAPAV